MKLETITIINIHQELRRYQEINKLDIPYFENKLSQHLQNNGIICCFLKVQKVFKDVLATAFRNRALEDLTSIFFSMLFLII